MSPMASKFSSRLLCRQTALPQHNKQRLDNPQRRRIISESDYAERSVWRKYIEAYEEAIEGRGAPWFVIPADHKWF